MFEGLVSQVLAGILGRYVKGIQKDQLKIGIWNEEVLLENVELNLEAFDYLQLPFALKNGQAGKLSIKIPWKKLGWDPIIIVLEDVFISACQREDAEWSFDSVDKREIAGKMAKLNAIELAKFSSRITDNRTGQSFLSYMSAKILDNIQVSIRNVHVVYVDAQISKEKFVFGLRFSSLTVMTDTTRHSFSSSLIGKLRSGQVSKIIEISDACFFCNQLDEGLNNILSSDFMQSRGSILEIERNIDDYIIEPFDITVSVLANKPGKLDGAPQYDIDIELNGLALSASEIQIQQMLSLSDHLTICALREKYGRYRPSQISLVNKEKGWQLLWWHYARDSVLSEVRKKLRKTSWRTLGQRLINKRRYVNLYKKKLELLQKEQFVSADILQELEEMDKECDIDDILNYRACAEQQLQVGLSMSRSLSLPTDAQMLEEKLQTEEQSSAGRGRRWLNWLSLGMLGAGGTADTSTFAGVVSDDIIKDITEGMEFHVVSSSTNDSSVKEKFYTSSIKLSVSETVASVSLRSHGRKIAEAKLSGFGLECKVWDDSASIFISLESLQITNPCNGNLLLVLGDSSLSGDTFENQGALSVQIDLADLDSHAKPLVQVVVYAFEAVYDEDFFLGLMYLHDVLSSIELQHNRVMSSLSRFENFPARVFSKVEYLSANRKKLRWDITIHNFVIRAPLQHEELVFEMEALHLKTTDKTTRWHEDILPGCDFMDIYDNFEVDLMSCEVKILVPNADAAISILEKSNGAVLLSRCLLLDEPKVKQLEVDWKMPSVHLCFSKKIYRAISEAQQSVSRFQQLHAKNTKPTKSSHINAFASVKIAKVRLDLCLDYDMQRSAIVSYIIGDMDIRCALAEFPEVWVDSRAIEVEVTNFKDKPKLNLLHSSNFTTENAYEEGFSPVIGCLQLNYKYLTDTVNISLSDVELHLYPEICGLLSLFFRTLNPISDPSTKNEINDIDSLSDGDQSYFGFSNYINDGISVNQFPFLVPSELRNYYGEKRIPLSKGATNILVSLNKIKLHFHDWSCILGIGTIPEANVSFSYNKEYSDFLMSVRSMHVISSLANASITGLFLGPSEPSKPNIANVRIRKVMSDNSVRPTEIRFAFQNTCCILSSEYVALVVGYFDLPEWDPPMPNEKISDVKNIWYQFEIIESFVFLPVEKSERMCMRVAIPKLFGKIIKRGTSVEAGAGLPSQCLIKECLMPDKSDIVDIFARGLSISFCALDEQTRFMKFEEYMLNSKYPLLETLDADVFIRMPWNTGSVPGYTSVPDFLMMHVWSCSLVALDINFLPQLATLSDVMDEFSTVRKESRNYKSDALLYLHNKRSGVVSVELQRDSILSMKLCLAAFSVNLSKSDKLDSLKYANVGSAHLGLDLSVVVSNQIPIYVGADVNRVVLYSYLNSRTLISYTSEKSDSSQFQISYTVQEGAADQIFAAVPFLDIWLYLIDWKFITKHLDLYTQHSDNTLSLIGGKELTVFCSDESQCGLESDGIDDLVVNCENFNVRFHFPVLQSEGGDNKHIITFSFHGKRIDASKGEKFVKLMIELEMLKVLLNILQDEKETCSIPFMQINSIKAVVESNKRSTDMVNIIDVKAEMMDAGLSYQVFSFLSSIQLEFPEMEASRSSSSVLLKVHLRKGSILLSDGRWSYHGPIMKAFLKDVTAQVEQMDSRTEASASAHLLINYNNIDKVMWEPFLEPWSFGLNFERKIEGGATRKYATADIQVKSLKELNVNITEPLIEALFRINSMIEDSRSSICRGSAAHHTQSHDIGFRRYAPYIISNETGLPLRFKVFRGPINADELLKHVSAVDESNVLPGLSVPIYVEEIVEEFFFRHTEARSSEQLIEKKLNSVPHHMISVQFEGTSTPSALISMDFVGVTSFEIDFSSGQRAALTVPVVLEVSMQHYSKMIRLYSTVVLINDTSMPLELRFDIPFGVSSTVIGPIQANQEIPLPLHLSEAGRIRWHPGCDGYLWSEAHLLSSLLSHENKLGFMRSFVCYPSHPSNDPFRCCISVKDYELPCTQRQSIEAVRGKRNIEMSSVKKHFMRQVRLTTPLVVKNYLPIRVSLTIDCCGSAHSVALSEVDTASVFLVDSSYDLTINFHIDGYNPVTSKFPRAELFSTVARRSSSKYSLKETISFFSDSSNGPLNVILERSMDAYCGARELCLHVPFLIYNSTDLMLALTENNNEGNSGLLVLPSICNRERNDRLKEISGLSILSSGFDADFLLSSSSSSITAVTSNINENNFEREVKAHMYIPPQQTPTSELLVKLSSACAALTEAKYDMNSVWSSAFLLVPSSGSTNISVPKSGGAGAYLISAISVPVSEELTGRTRAIAFHPRFVICNACSKDLFFKQKGTRPFSRLNVGKHTYLHSSDTTREFLVSIRFDGPGWQWSGSFLPDRLGDTQIKMQNYVAGISTMVRVEVQHADFANHNGKSVQPNGNSATLLILLSDDKTGFMPYRIDNFSMEKLRVHQHRCESIETIVHPYTSCQYAWDEPFYPHRLIVEVPGERVLGAYNLDDEHENMHVNVPASLDKPDRTFCISIYAEGAMKVLSVVDSSCHTIQDMKETGFIGFKERENMDQKLDDHLNFTKTVTLEFPFVGISLISSSPQELLFACAKDTKLMSMQSFDRHKISFKISSLQIDNQLSETQYPIMLSFDRAFRRGPLSFLRKERKLRLQNVQNERTDADSKSDFFYLAATIWTATDASLLSFQHINIAVAPLCIELEERLVLSLLDFFRAVSSRLHARSLENDSDLHFHEAYRDFRTNSFIKRSSGEFEGNNSRRLLPSVVPIGAPFHQIYLLARRQRKVYVELFELAPIELSLSFTSSPWLSRSDFGSDIDVGASNSANTIQRGLMALIEVEGVPVHLRELVMENLIASLDSMEDILVRHYMRQLLHEMYKVFGSAGVIGNPMGFARNVGLGLKDFFSASSKGLLQSPSELLSGIAEGSRTLLGSTIYAISSATTQFSKTAYKGVAAFTFDDRVESEMDEWRRHLDLHGKGVLNAFLEGLTGFLQSPIRGVEKHGLPGVVSGIALGTAGLVAKPMASILEATGKTAQSIRNRSNPHQFNRLRVRFPRSLQRDLPLFPYSWHEAIGTAVLKQANNHKLQNEIFVMCKPLKKPGYFVVITEKLLLVVSSCYLTELGKETFAGVPPDPVWVTKTEMQLESVVHVDRSNEVVNIVGSNADTLAKQQRGYVRNAPWRLSGSSPLFHASVELMSLEEAEDTMQVVMALVEKGRMQRWDANILHRRNLS